MRLFLERYMYPVFFLSAFSYHYLSTVKRDKHNKKQGLKPLERKLSKTYKTSDTLFILGSGSSINSISDMQWSIIEQHDSVGFNFWLIHDFVPDFFKFELALETDNKRTDYFYQMLNDKWHLYKEKLIIYNHNKPYLDIPEPLKQKMNNATFFYPRYTVVPGLNYKAFKKSLIIFKKYYSIFPNSSLLFRKRSSVLLLISIALMWGYQNVVLCGIDLNNNKYFYEDDYYKRRYPGFHSGQGKNIHQSFDPTIHPLTIDKIIKAVNEIFFLPIQKKLFILNKSSALYPGLPIFH